MWRSQARNVTDEEIERVKKELQEITILTIGLALFLITHYFVVIKI